MTQQQLPAIAKGLAIVIAVIAYYVLAHIVSTSEHPGFLGVMLAVSPLLFGAGIYAWRAKHYAVLALCALAIALLWIARGFFAEHVEWIYLMQHAGGNLFLAIVFGITLRAGHTALCTEMAMLTYGDEKLPDEVIPYTRHVTLAWTIFFCSVCATSLVLFFCAPETVWSVFANLLTIPLVALMFAAEYLVRVLRFPHLERKGVLSAVRAYWKMEADKLHTAETR